MSLESTLLHTPVAMGLMAKVLADVIHDLCVEADKQGIIKKNEGWLKPAEIALSLAVTVLQVALTTGLSNITVGQIEAELMPLIQVLLGVKAAGTVTAKALAQKARESVKAQLAK